MFGNAFLEVRGMACVNPTGAPRANDVDKVHCRRNLAPEVGFEPTTNRLTADRSTTELLRSVVGKDTSRDLGRFKRKLSTASQAVIRARPSGGPSRFAPSFCPFRSLVLLRSG